MKMKPLRMGRGTAPIRFEMQLSEMTEAALIDAQESIGDAIDCPVSASVVTNLAVQHLAALIKGGDLDKTALRSMVVNTTERPIQ